LHRPKEPTGDGFPSEDVEPAGVGEQIRLATDGGERTERFGVALNDSIALADQRRDAGALAGRAPAYDREIRRGLADGNHQPEQLRSILREGIGDACEALMKL